MAAYGGYPYGAPPPSPYLPAVIVRPETVAGIKTYQIGLLLDIIFGVFALIISGTFLLMTVTDPLSAVAAFALLGSAVCGLLIVFVINFIVSLMSVFKMHHGANEYGPEHARNARNGFWFKWIGTTLSTLAAILVVYIFVSGASAFFVPGAVPPTVYVPLMVTAFWTGGVSCKAQMYRFMVRSLQTPETRSRSELASLLIPILGVVGIVIVGVTTAQVIAAIQNPAAVDPIVLSQLTLRLVGGVFLPPGLALGGYVIFLSIYLQTSERLSRALASIHAAMPVTPWYVAPPPSLAPVPSPAPQSPPPPLGTVVAPPSASPAFCPQCGHPAPPGALFCLNCGTRLKA